MNETTSAKFQNAILEIISKALAHEKTGNRDGEQSVSYVLSELRYAGWRNLSNTNRLEDLAKAAGFTVREEYRGNGQRRAYIGL